MARREKRPGDRHLSGFMVRLPEAYRKKLRRMAKAAGTPMTVALQNAIDQQAATPKTWAAPRRQTLEEYDRTHDNGCSICRDPNCSEPGGQH